jgi:hypothetical protein
MVIGELYVIEKQKHGASWKNAKIDQKNIRTVLTLQSQNKRVIEFCRIIELIERLLSK